MFRDIYHISIKTENQQGEVNSFRKSLKPPTGLLETSIIFIFISFYRIIRAIISFYEASLYDPAFILVIKYQSKMK